MGIDFLLSNKDAYSFAKVILNKDVVNIADTGYWDFMQTGNGGFFFRTALLVYPILSVEAYPSIEVVNNALKDLYANLFDGLFSFAQDIFGNQFCFEIQTGSIVWFNIEDARRTFVAKKFEEWIDVFTKDYDYYAGVTYIDEWLESNELKIDERLCPKYPFIVGGDFKISNFYASTFPAFLALNADIARQIHDLPDGTKVVFKIKK